MEKAASTIVKKEQWPDVIKGCPFKNYTNNGIIGDALRADADKGKRIVEYGVEQIADFIRNDLEA